MQLLAWSQFTNAYLSQSTRGWSIAVCLIQLFALGLQGQKLRLKLLQVLHLLLRLVPERVVHLDLVADGFVEAAGHGGRVGAPSTLGRLRKTHMSIKGPMSSAKSGNPTCPPTGSALSPRHPSNGTSPTLRFFSLIDSALFSFRSREIAAWLLCIVAWELS